MSKYKKSSMREGQNKTKRMLRLDQLLRSPEGLTLKEILMDSQMDDISERTLRICLRELETDYHAHFAHGLKRGREGLWRYKDTNFHAFGQTSKDMEVIRKSIEKLDIFKGDPRYDLLRYYLMGLENDVNATNLNFMSFDNNNDAEGLEFVDVLLDAIVHKYPIKLWYKDFSETKYKFNVHPYHLHQYNRRWHLFGLNEEKKAVWQWPLDRIEMVEHLSKPYIPTDINFDEYFDDIVGVTNFAERDVKDVKIKVKREKFGYYRTKPLHWTQTELKDENTEEYATLRLRVKLNHEMIMLLLSYGDEIEVVSPLELREEIKDIINKMRSNYEV